MDDIGSGRCADRGIRPGALTSANGEFSVGAGKPGPVAGLVGPVSQPISGPSRRRLRSVSAGRWRRMPWIVAGSCRPRWCVAGKVRYPLRMWRCLVSSHRLRNSLCICRIPRAPAHCSRELVSIMDGRARWSRPVMVDAATTGYSAVPSRRVGSGTVGYCPFGPVVRCLCRATVVFTATVRKRSREPATR